MTSRAVLMALSLAGNVALIGLIFAHGSHSQPPVARGDLLEPVRQGSTTPRQFSAQGSFSNNAELLPIQNSGFNWAQLESADYEKYIAALRAFGVPERTVRDIVIADVDKMYRPKLAALRGTRKQSGTNFWETRNFYGPATTQTKEQREQTATLQKEKRELVKSLLGDDVYRQMAKDAGRPDWTERMYGSLPDDLRDKVIELQERFNAQRAEIYAKAEGYIDQDTQNDLKTLTRKAREEMGGVLTPEQLQDYELRNSEISSRMRWELAGFAPNEKEFRAIFNYKQSLEDLRSDNFDNSPGAIAERKPEQDKRQALDAQLKEQLGDRYKEFQMTEQWEYRNLSESGVPREALLQVADMKQQTQDAATKLRQDKSLSPEQKKQALEAIRTEAETKLTEIVGERRAKAYLNNGGYWVRNLAPRN